MVMFLTGAPGDGDEAEARAVIIEGIRSLGSVGRETGVPVGVEPIHRTASADFSIITDLPGAEALLEEAGDDSVGILFDTWHLWDTPDVLEHACRLAPRFPAVHVNDWRGETRDWDDRVLPGEGVMDLPAILGALEAGGYDGWYDMEIFSGEHYPDSLMKLDPAEMVRRGREGFLRAWEVPEALDRRRRVERGSWPVPPSRTAPDASGAKPSAPIACAYSAVTGAPPTTTRARSRTPAAAIAAIASCMLTMVVVSSAPTSQRRRRRSRSPR